jgi:hypothetical protein
MIAAKHAAAEAIRTHILRILGCEGYPVKSKS